MSPTAVGLVLLSAAIHAWWNYLIKRSASPRAFSAVVSVWTILLLCAALPFCRLSEIPGPVWALLLGSSVVHTTYRFTLSSAYTHGDISLVYPIARSGPAFVPIFAVALLGERLSPGGVAGIAVVVAAVWVINSGGRLSLRMFAAPGAVYAYLTLATVVAYSLTDKAAMARFHEAPWTATVPRALLFMLLEQGVACFFYLAVVAPRLPRAEVLQAFRMDRVRAGLVSLGEVASYALILYVYQSEQVSYVVAVRQTSVIIGVLLGTLRLGEAFGRPRLIGASGLVFGVYLIARYA